jgi:hypothetical protein
MPASYRIDKSLGLVLSTAQGVLTGQDILTHRRRLREDPDIDPNYNQLIDLRDVIDFSVSTAEMRMIATDYIFGENSHRAIVAEKAHNFGMARMYVLFSEALPDQMMVYRDMAEARRWLGLDEATNSN